MGEDHRRAPGADGPSASLEGQPGTRVVNGIELEQWQYEVTGAGRLWYCIDDTKRTIWLTEASPGHPRATE